MKKIIERRVPDQIGAELPEHLHPILRRLYGVRNVRSTHELERSLNQLAPYASMLGINEAIALLSEALEQQRRILIVADFDADGATSCALAMRALRMMGAKDVRYIVPNRFQFGYGLTPEIVAVAAEQQPDLLITVDNGISSMEGVEAARACGMRVLITDHHLPAATLPPADAIVNPNQPGDGFPSKHLAGVGVIFYVMLALRASLREQGWFERKGLAEPNMASLLDLVALGTVADVVTLDHNNRILVGQGLARLRAGQCCAGIRAMLEVAGRSLSRITASDLGYSVGPRLNAAGRLEDMSLGIACLLTDDPMQARAMAIRLDELNKERRAIESQMQDEAWAVLNDKLESQDEKLPAGLCLYDESWHQGVIGILASRIKDRMHRPVIAFAKVSDDELKGSARSVSGVHIRDVLDAVAARHPGLISKFGGHAMAAGMTLDIRYFEDFRQAFDEEVRRHVDESDLKGIVYSDGELAAEDMTLEMAELLRSAGPWGQGFPEPVFDGIFDIVQWRIVGEKHLKFSLRPQGGSKLMEAIEFNSSFKPEDQAKTVRIAYRLDVNEYRGNRSTQLLVEHIEPLVQ